GASAPFQSSTMESTTARRTSNRASAATAKSKGKAPAKATTTISRKAGAKRSHQSTPSEANLEDANAALRVAELERELRHERSRLHNAQAGAQPEVPETDLEGPTEDEGAFEDESRQFELDDVSNDEDNDYSAGDSQLRFDSGR